ncbi:hypothetical protein LTR85_008280 [Meristemomyces frigidus]|nr:hypothetical protein LTR85_008280 [Meristemomyces frigidus]
MLNASSDAPPLDIAPVAISTTSAAGNALDLQLSFVNNLASSNVHAYMTGLVDGNLVLLQAGGGWFYPPNPAAGEVHQAITADIAIPLGSQGSTTNIALPGNYVSSGRIYFADGTLDFFVNPGDTGPSLVQPSSVNPSDSSADVNWGFIELTTSAADGIFADITYVDFVGLPLGLTLESADGNTQTAPGVPAGGIADVCSGLQAQATKDGQPWDRLCMDDADGNLLRVLSPEGYLAYNSSAFSDYFTEYVDQVWAHYAQNVLTIDTQAAAGVVNCTVKPAAFGSGTTSAELTCTGDNRGYAQPSAADIFGCDSGPFYIAATDNAVHVAVVPRLCAALNRATLLQEGGDQQPSEDPSGYYTTSPNNWYSAIVHENELDHRGYAFAYDDVGPNGGQDQAGAVSDGNPTKLTVTVGGPSSA